MKPVTHNFTIPQGTTFQLPIIWKSKSTGLPVDLTGYSAKLQARKEFNGDALITLIDGSEESGIVLLNSEGKLTLYFSASASNISSGVYKYDLLLTCAEVKIRLMQGVISITPRVTE